MLGGILSEAPPDSTFLKWMNPTAGDSGAFYPVGSSYANEKGASSRPRRELLWEAHSLGEPGKHRLTFLSCVPLSSK